MKNKRWIIFGILSMVLLAGLMLVIQNIQKDSSIQNTKPIIAVSTFSLYEAARAVAGDTLEILPIVPLGSDAHMFSPNPSQVAQISSAAFFVYNGAGFETWAQTLKNTLPSTTNVIDMSSHVTLLKSDDAHEEHGDHADHADHEEHQHGAYDPHYWLDIENMIQMTQTLEREFSSRFPENAQVYHTNATGYVTKLQKLKEDYEAGLKECKNRTLVSNHDAFGYLAHANRLENISVIGLSSDEQPSASTIAQVVTLVKEHGIKTIFFEEMVNDNIAQTIARETGAKAQPLQPLENISEDELKSHQTYESIMRTNLAKLTQAMECR